MNFLIPDDKNQNDVTDNNVGKMSDNEVIKALECCSGEVWQSCLICPYRGRSNCTKDLKLDIAEVLNRLKAEIEAKEIEYNDMLEQRKSVEKHLKTAKAEAYKECVEKVKEKYPFTENSAFSINPFALHKFLNNLLKEWVGE